MTRIDTVRKILFGGARVVDTDTQTVLERAYLPGMHTASPSTTGSASGEIGKLTPWNVAEITLCNTTYAADGNSEDHGAAADPRRRGQFCLVGGQRALSVSLARITANWKSDIFNSPNPGTNNGNDPATTGLNAEADNRTGTTTVSATAITWSASRPACRV